ncbi:MAG: histidine kinase [Candidatus Acidiferrales bacterium]
MDSFAQAVERLKGLARLVLAASLGVALLLVPPRGTPLGPLLAFVFALYFLFAILALVFHRQLATRGWRAATVAGDAAVLGVILLVAPQQPAAFLLFFLYFTLMAGLWRGWWLATGLSVLVSAAYFVLAWRDAVASAGAAGFAPVLRENWAVLGGLIAAGTLVGALAGWQRHSLEEGAEVERFARLLSLDTRWPRLWQRWLQALCERLGAARALLAYHDPETDLVALWRFGFGEPGDRLEESDRPPRDAHTFLLEAAPLSLLGNRLGQGAAEDWQLRHEFSPVAATEKNYLLPERFASEIAPGSLLTVPVAVAGEWCARLFLLDARRGSFASSDLDELQRLMAGLAPLLANLLTVRSLITQAVNEQRDHISRALHDGVAQSLASLEMQLNVQRRQPADPARAAEGLERLQNVVRQEQESLRRFVLTLKPVRVPAAELNRWIMAHCAQFQQETAIAVDVEADPVDARLPEGVCREVFLILREALHNVRKHAGAKNVRVQLRQNEDTLRLVVDDDGKGFPFSGCYSQAELEARGLLPVSVGDHTRFLGGTLSIDSTPGIGATLRVEIPLH